VEHLIVFIVEAVTKYEEEYFCSKCFVHDPNNKTCVLCQISYDSFDYWQCVICDITFCYTCNPARRLIIAECGSLNCYYCKMGYCRNNSMSEETYCGNCFQQNNDNNDNNDSDFDSDEILSDSDSYSNESDEEEDEEPATYDPSKHVNPETATKILACITSKKYNALSKLCGLTITKIEKFNMTYDDDIKCTICCDNNVNCQVSCGHTYCINCYIQNNKIMGSNHCAICREFLDNNLIILASAF
jgi:hypothetical protein